MNQLKQHDLELHVKILGWLHIVGSSVLALTGFFLLALLTGVGAASGDPDTASILGIVGPALCVFLVALSAPGIAAGYGLLRRKSWGRVLAIVVGVINLMNFPIGTAIGVYTLWVLMQDEANSFFLSLKAA